MDMQVKLFSGPQGYTQLYFTIVSYIKLSFKSIRDGLQHQVLDLSITIGLD